MDTPAPVATSDAILAALADLAPELDPAMLAPGRPLRDQVDLDSMDWLHLLEALGQRLGVALPTSRLGPRTTLAELVAAAERARRSAAHRAQRRAPGSAFTPKEHRLSNGRRVTVRPITAADAPLEAEFVRSLSVEARRMRFMSSLRELTPSKLRYFTEVDQVNHVALVATATVRRTPSIVGVARCVVEPGTDRCEFAIVVGDRWQRSGLGSVLMTELMRAARERGLREIYGVVFAANRKMLRLARQLGFQAQPQTEEPGTVRVARPL